MNFFRLFKRRPDPVAGEVYREKKGANPFIEPTRAQVREVREGWVRYQLQFPERGRPWVYCCEPIKDFLRVYPIKEVEDAQVV